VDAPGDGRAANALAEAKGGKVHIVATRSAHLYENNGKHGWLKMRVVRSRASVRVVDARTRAITPTQRRPRRQRVGRRLNFDDASSR